MKHFSAIAALTAMLLTGCEEGLLPDPLPSPAEARAQADFQAAAEAQSRAQEGHRCESFGAKPGTDAYVQCMVSLSQSDAKARQDAQDKREDRRRAIIRALLTPAPHTTCTTTAVGNTAYSDCN